MPRKILTSLAIAAAMVGGTWGYYASTIPPTEAEAGYPDDVVRTGTASEFDEASDKSTPVAADWILIEDSAASGAKKRITAGTLLIAGDVTGTLAASVVAAGAVDGGMVATVAAESVLGGIPVIHMHVIDGGANDSQDITVTYATQVIDFHCVLGAAGTAGSAVTLNNSGTAITNTIDLESGGNEDVFRAAEIDDAQDALAAAGTLRVVTASTGGDCPAMICYTTAIRIP